MGAVPTWCWIRSAARCSCLLFGAYGTTVGWSGFTAAPGRFAFDLNEIYSRQLHVTGLATVFYDGAHVARLFDQFRALFDHGLLAPPAVKTWPLGNSAEAYQTVIDGSAGIKQVLLPIGSVA